MIEAMKQALEALEMLLTLDTHDEMHLLETDIAPKAIAALRQAIEQVEKQEPVAYIDSRDGCLLSAEDWTEYERSIAAQEREACAKLCEQLGASTNGTYERNVECATAIREMGEK